MSPRPYKLGRRSAAVAETRSRILTAARDIIVDAGPADFTIDAVASKAGVARMTVYYQFHSKRGLLEALFDEIGASGGIERLPGVFSNPEPLQALASFIGTFVGFWASDRIIFRRLRALAVLDAEFEPAVRGREDRRRWGLKVILERVAARRGLTSDIDLEEIADLLHVLTSFETYDSLAEAGWGPDQVARAITDIAFAALGLDAGSGRDSGHR
jgi:AcrR family transcriptional regulator